MTMSDLPPPGSSDGSAAPHLALHTTPITEADLHAYVDGQLTPERAAQVQALLASRPDEQARVQAWAAQNALMQRLLGPVADEPLPLRLTLQPTARTVPWRGLAASVAVAMVSALVSAGAAWSLRGAVDAQAARQAMLNSPVVTAGNGDLTGFARRAAVAHVVYTPDVRRPVEVRADQEQALVTWLTKRMGTTVRPPALGPLGYELVGGRLLPGEHGPVAQFMYATASGLRLTLYVTREVPGPDTTAFQFGRDGPVNVFYWVENHLGYAISAGADRAELMRVSQAVYRQLKGE